MTVALCTLGNCIKDFIANTLLISLTASRHLVGIHIEDLSHIASEASANGGFKSSDWRALVTNG